MHRGQCWHPIPTAGKSHPAATIKWRPVAAVNLRALQITSSQALLHKSGVGWADVYAQRLERWLC